MIHILFIVRPFILSDVVINVFPRLPSLSGAEEGRARLIMDLFCHKAIKSVGPVSCLKRFIVCRARVREAAVGIFNSGT